MAHTRRSLWLALLLALVWVVGCSSNEFTLYIESTEKTNEGKVFYVVIRLMDEKSFIAESYQEMTGKMFKTELDKSVVDKSFLSTQEVYPGKDGEVTVEIPEENKKPIGIFFIFSKPGERWKTLVPQPLPSSYEVTLGQFDIDAGE